MSVVNTNNILKELVNSLRSSDVLTITERGVITKTDTFSAAGGPETFNLTVTNCKNVRSVTHEGDTLSFGTDYILNYNATNNIGSVSVLKTLTEDDEIKVTYDYGNGDRIYPDWARPDITISSVPRINFNFVTKETSLIAVGGVESFNPRMQFDIFDTNVYDIQEKETKLRQWVKDNHQDLYYSNILRSVGGLPYEVVREEGKNKIFKLSIDILNELNIER